MQRRRAPRRLGSAVGDLVEQLAPQTGLAAVQRVWAEAVGDVIAAQAQPTAERDGVLTVTCSSSVWAQELDLMAPELLERLGSALGTGRIQRLRCQAAPARSWARKG